MRAVHRRAGSEEQEESDFNCEQLHIDFARRIVTLADDEIHLTPKEYELLVLLINNANRVLTHRQLLTKVWGLQYAEDHHSLRVHIANLRNKIEKDPTRPVFIQTETRVGYRFVSIND